MQWLYEFKRNVNTGFFCVRSCYNTTLFDTMSLEGAKMSPDLGKLKSSLEGDLYIDETMRTIYATDASPYQEMPLAIVRPRNSADIQKVVEFAAMEGVALIPRAAGTSLSGQCVGAGIVVDISKYMTAIIELNIGEKWVRVQPGVIRDELNQYLAPHGLCFGPETSTGNRCMMGGMVGNNACGAHSILYGSTREHTLEVEAVLSDGSDCHFGPLTADEFKTKLVGERLENKLYRHIWQNLSKLEFQAEIKKEFPKSSVERRNTGYAIDRLSETSVFGNHDRIFNFCNLIAGSEGTLAFIKEIKLNLVPLPPPSKGLVCAHFKNIDEALKANLIALKYKPGAIELIDKIILDCTKTNSDQIKNRFFVQGDPGAILIIEFERETIQEIEKIAHEMQEEMQRNHFGYAFPVVYAGDINKVWSLRKAGLGLLANVPGDGKPVSFIEDTAVDVNDLPQYISEFRKMLNEYKLSCVYHAHAATGELHLRPILDLKLEKDVALFREIGEKVAKLVKKFNGSLSGEHGDGRLRGEFIPLMVGPKIYSFFEDIKKTWDPQNIFNPGKIVKTPQMNTFLRYQPGQETRQFETLFNFDKEGGILRAAEKCNGSGDCRKTENSGGTMCPSYMATKDEFSTTRARANILRNFLTKSENKNKFNHKEIYDVMDLCLSCKGCKSECPSNVDVAKLKAEFLYQYYKEHGIPWRSKFFGNISKINQMNSKIPRLANFMMRNSLTSSFMKKIMGVAKERKLPQIALETTRRWANNNPEQLKPSHAIGKVYLFNDEFTNYLDAEIGKKATRVLVLLGYEVVFVNHWESGRSFISKGMLAEAKEVAIKNITLFSDLITEETPLIGVEPSAILSFRDEYIELVPENLKEKAVLVSKNAFLIDEFIHAEMLKGNISSASFTSVSKKILLHGHCHQKAMGSVNKSKEILSLPKNYKVDIVPSGCCGMAGSFGYEKEHYDISMQVGELVLFPAIRKTDEKVLIAAPGTSCRHQIHDGTKRTALHPVEILYEALT